MRISLSNKTCRDCRQDKPPVDFYLTGNGRLMHVCKDCHKRAAHNRRLTNPVVQEYERRRAKRPERKALSRSVNKKWREGNPTAYKAQNAVNNALRDGKLMRGPCSLCGATKHVHGHHRDYTKPLDVVWLCAKCHHRLHAAFPELGGHFAEAAE